MLNIIGGYFKKVPSATLLHRLLTMSSADPPEFALPLRDVLVGVVESSKRRRPKGKCHFSKEEKQVLEKYKDLYKKSTTTEQRLDVLRNYLLVDIFNFWHAKGEVTSDISEAGVAERVKACRKHFMNYNFI